MSSSLRKELLEAIEAVSPSDQPTPTAIKLPSLPIAPPEPQKPLKLEPLPTVEDTLPPVESLPEVLPQVEEVSPLESQGIVRDFSVCPRCGSTTRPAKALDGGVSTSWYKCSRCRTYIHTYVPQPHQAALHADPHRYVGNFGGYGTGKTTTTREELYKHLFLTPGANALIGAATTIQYEQTIKRDIESDIPQDFVKGVSVQKAYIDLINGARLMFRPLDDEGKLRSYNLSFFAILEASETELELYTQLKARLRNMAAAKQLTVKGVPQTRAGPGGQLIPVWEASWHRGIVESNPDSGWVRTSVLLVSDDIKKFGDIPDTYMVLGEQRDPYTASYVTETKQNAYLLPTPEEFVSQLCANKPVWWVNRYVKGSFNYAEGLVYPNALAHVVPTFTVPPEWKRVVAFDYGLADDAVFIWAAIDEAKGIVYIYREARTNNTSVEQLAQMYFENSQDIPSGGLLTQPIIDPKSGPRRDYDQKSLISHFLEYGINFKPGQVSLDARIFRVNTYIEAGYLKIMDCCTGLIEELREYKYPPRQLGDNRPIRKPEDKNNHGVDPMGWIIMELPKNPKDILYGVYNRMGQDVTKETASPSIVMPWQLSGTRDYLQHEDVYSESLFDNSLAY